MRIPWSFHAVALLGLLICTTYPARVARAAEGDFGCYLYSCYGSSTLNEETTFQNEADPKIHGVVKSRPVYYQVQAPPGEYKITVHYLDAGESNTGSFGIEFNGKRVEEKIACYAPNRKQQVGQVRHESVTRTATVADRGLRIRFPYELAPRVDHCITAIEIVGEPMALRINCGARQDYTDGQGRIWLHDRELPFPDITIQLDENDKKNEWVNIGDEIMEKMEQAGVEPVVKWYGHYTGGLNGMFYDRSGRVYLNPSGTGLWVYEGPGGKLYRADGNTFSSVAKGWSLNPYGPGFVLICSHGFNPTDTYQALAWDGVTIQTWPADGDVGAADWQAEVKDKPIFTKPRHNNILVLCRENGAQCRQVEKKDGIANVGALGEGVLVYTMGGRGDRPEFGIYRSADNGMTWTKVKDGNFGSNVNCQSIFSYGQRAYLHHEDGLYKSTDRGKTWRLVPDSPGFEYSVQPGKDDSHLVGISRDGVYESTDLGETWKKIAPAPPVGKGQKWIQSHDYYDFTWDYVKDVFYVSAPDTAYRYARE